MNMKVGKGKLTGLPVMESPRAIIRTWPEDCAEMSDASVSMTPKKASRERRVAMVVPRYKDRKPPINADQTRARSAPRKGLQLPNIYTASIAGLSNCLERSVPVCIYALTRLKAAD